VPLGRERGLQAAPGVNESAVVLGIATATLWLIAFGSAAAALVFAALLVRLRELRGVRGLLREMAPHLGPGARVMGLRVFGTRGGRPVELRYGNRPRAGDSQAWTTLEVLVPRRTIWLRVDGDGATRGVPADVVGALFDEAARQRQRHLGPVRIRGVPGRLRAGAPGWLSPEEGARVLDHLAALGDRLDAAVAEADAAHCAQVLGAPYRAEADPRAARAATRARAREIAREIARVVWRRRIGRALGGIVLVAALGFVIGRAARFVRRPPPPPTCEEVVDHIVTVAWRDAINATSQRQLMLHKCWLEDPPRVRRCIVAAASLIGVARCLP